MFKSVEKWLCKSGKYKTVAGGSAILEWEARPTSLKKMFPKLRRKIKKKNYPKNSSFDNVV
jgi:hypothetical protein